MIGKETVAELKKRSVATIGRLSTAVVAFCISFPIAGYIIQTDGVPYLREAAVIVWLASALYGGLVAVATVGYLMFDVSKLEVSGMEGGFSSMPILNRFILKEILK